MIEIDKTRIDLYLKMIYNQKYHFLKKLEIDYPHIQGTFVVPPTFYTVEVLDHLSDVEAQLCLNQLAYIGFMEAIKNKQILSLNSAGAKRISYGAAIIGKSEKKFKGIIDPSKEIHGVLNAKRIFNLEEKIIALTHFDLENGKCTGKLNITLVKKK